MKYLLLFPTLICSVSFATPCWKELLNNPFQDSLRRYALLDACETEASFLPYSPKLGFTTSVRRDSIHFRILIDNPDLEVAIVGDFNLWGKDSSTDFYRLKTFDGGKYYEGDVPALEPGTEYLIQVSPSKKPGEIRHLLDPAGTTSLTPQYQKRLHGYSYPAPLRSIYWPLSEVQFSRVDLRGTYLDILELDIESLVKKYRGGPREEAETYRFITESGVIDEIKSMGYTAVEFLPYHTSVDPKSWKEYYQVYGLFGPSSRWGTPDEFQEMVRKFNESGIAIIGDMVIAHYPFSGNSDERKLERTGVHLYRKGSGKETYGDLKTEWGTFRYDFSNPEVRKFLVEAVLANFSRYGISGIRIDNLDGIRFYPRGGGDEFLKELAQGLQKHFPSAIVLGEMFFPHTPVTKALKVGGLGVSLRNHSDLFDYFKDYLKNKTEDLELHTLRDRIRGPWNWQDTLRFSYITNHDEAANPRGGFTGAYPATLLKHGDGSWPYVERKIRTFGSLAKLVSSASLDMPQMRFLQEGSYNDNPALDWRLLELLSQRTNVKYFGDLSRELQDPAFAPQNLHPGIENHIDNQNKVLSLVRIDFTTGKHIYALINLGHHAIENYRFGCTVNATYRVAINSDSKDYGGTGELERRLPSGKIVASNVGDHSKPFSLTVPFLGPYGVVLLKQLQ